MFMKITEDTKLIPGDVIKYVNGRETFYADVIKVQGGRIYYHFHHWDPGTIDNSNLTVFIGQYYKQKPRTYKQIFIHKLMNNK